jgi:hypothetical protein
MTKRRCFALERSNSSSLTPAFLIDHNAPGPSPETIVMTSLTCPSCNHVLTATEVQDGWCDECGKKLPAHLSAHVTAAPRSSAVATSGPPPRVTVSRQDIPGWGTVRAGLAQVIVGGILFGLGFLVTVWLESSQDVLTARAQGVGLLFLVQLLGLALACGAILFLVGLAMGCAAPEAGPRGCAVAQVICMVLLYLFYALVLPALLTNGVDPNPRLVLIIFQVLGFGQMVFALFFLRGVAGALGNASLARGILIFMAIALPLAVVENVLAHILPDRILPVRSGETVAWLFLGSAVAFAVSFLVLAGLARATITRALRG